MNEVIKKVADGLVTSEVDVRWIDSDEPILEFVLDDGARYRLSVEAIPALDGGRSAAPQAVSRVLAAAGERPLPSGTPRTREGVRVTGSVAGGSLVSVDHDSERGSKRRADRLQEILERAGFQVERRSDSCLSVS